MKRYLLFAFACAGFSVLCPLATAQGSNDPAAQELPKPGHPKTPNWSGPRPTSC